MVCASLGKNAPETCASNCCRPCDFLASCAAIVVPVHLPRTSRHSEAAGDEQLPQLSAAPLGASRVERGAPLVLWRGELLQRGLEKIISWFWFCDSTGSIQCIPGAKRQIEQLEPQILPVGQQAMDYQSLSAAAVPVQRSLGAINISLEEYRFLSDKLPQFRAQRALRAQEAQSPPKARRQLEVDDAATVAGGQWPRRFKRLHSHSR